MIILFFCNKDLLFDCYFCGLLIFMFQIILLSLTSCEWDILVYIVRVGIEKYIYGLVRAITNSSTRTF
jgi:hypothetical protein